MVPHGFPTLKYGHGFPNMKVNIDHMEIPEFPLGMMDTCCGFVSTSMIHMSLHWGTEEFHNLQDVSPRFKWNHLGPDL